MTKHDIEARILLQITHYPQYRGVARVVLKKVMFEGKAGKVSFADLFEYIVNSPNDDFAQIITHFKSVEVTVLLVQEDMPTYALISYGHFFTLLEMHVRKVLFNIIANFPKDHFQEECMIFLNSEVDFFETVDTLKNFLSHYNHPGLAAVEEVALVLDEKVLKIKQSHRAFHLLQQAATLLELHHPKTTIDTLFQPVYDLC